MNPACRGEGPGPEGERLPKAALLRRSADIRNMFRRGTRRRTPTLDIYTLPSDSAPSRGEAASTEARPRLGLVVPKHGHHIVERNLVKRRLREIGRRHVMPCLFRMAPSIDLLVRARRDAYGAPYSQLEAELLGVVEGVCSNG